MRRAVIMKQKFVVLLLIFISVCNGVCKAEGFQPGLSLPVAACLQYQRIKETRGTGYAPFRRYGFRPIQTTDSTKRLWGYHVAKDSSYTKSKPLYRMFKHHDLYSFAIIDNASTNGSCQYVFWWKGYYRQFVADLRRMGFNMTNDSKRTNVLRFTRSDINIEVEFIIWEDIYVMQTLSKE